LLPLVNADIVNVRHWLQQFHLVGANTEDEELQSLRLEWLKLAEHTCVDTDHDPFIHDEFHIHFPILHRRLQLNVDVCIMDSPWHIVGPLRYAFGSLRKWQKKMSIPKLEQLYLFD